MKPTLESIVKTVMILRCLNSGDSIKDIAGAMEVTPQKVRGMLRTAGYRRIRHLDKWMNW